MAERRPIESELGLTESELELTESELELTESGACYELVGYISSITSKLASADPGSFNVENNRSRDDLGSL
ncbi:MAG: hypothetical protein ACE361_17800 [Aureliella sp.]